MGLRSPAAPSPAIDLPVRRVTVGTMPDGSALGIDVHVGTPDPVNANGQTVLMMHGFPEYWGVWQPTLSALLEAGFRLLIPDQRGYNQSSRPPRDDAGSNYGIPQIAADGFAVLDALVPAGQKVLLVGHDFGGAVSWWMAMSQPERFERILIASMPHLRAFFRAWTSYPPQAWDSRYIGGVLTKNITAELARVGHCEMFAAVLESGSNKGTFDHHNLKPFREAWMQAGENDPTAAGAMLDWYNGLETTYNAWIAGPLRFSWPSRGGFVDVPVYYCDGNDDQYFVEQLVKPTMWLCRAPGSVAKLIPNASHWFFWDDPDYFNQKILLPWLRTGVPLPDAEAGTVQVVVDPARARAVLGESP